MEHTIAKILAQEVKNRHSKMRVTIDSSDVDVDVRIYNYYATECSAITIRIKDQFCTYKFYARDTTKYHQAIQENRAIWDKVGRIVSYYYSDPEFPDNLLGQIGLALSWPST